MQKVLNRLAQAHGMDDTVWARHANPWSGYTRIPILPLMALAIWARVWIGWWCLLPILALVVWAKINPNAFPRPASTRSWMSRAVMGERVLLNAAAVPIPAHHSRAARILTLVSILGLPPLGFGLWALHLWAVLAGLVVVIGGKLWFLDRMVWLYDDMARDNPGYRDWLR